MHIPDGILPTSVCLGGYALTGAGTWLSLRGVPRKEIPKASLMTGAFFVTSLIHIPIPPASVHLLMIGLIGVTLGRMALPAILVGLFFQAIMFQHGGLTTLGVNAVLLSSPAMLAFALFRFRHRFASERKGILAFLAFLSGSLPVVVGAAAAAVLLISTIPATLDVAVERASIMTLTFAHIPLAVIEGVVTAMIIMFLVRVKPDLLAP